MLQLDGTPSGSVAKNGRLILGFDKEHPESRYDPELQLMKAAETLRSLVEPIYSLPGVEKSQLQLFVYYDAKLAGEPDFLVPELLLLELVRNWLSLSVTILP